MYKILLKFFQCELSVYMWLDGRTDERTGRQTDMTKLIVAFRNFANAPQNLI